MSGIYATFPPGGGGGSGIPTYPNFAGFPAAGTVPDGSLAIALDTGILYEAHSGSWVVVGGPGAALSVGTFDSGVASANGAHIDANALIMQSASATVPGLVNTAAQTLAGAKTLSSAPILSSLTASTVLTLDGSKTVTSSAIGNLTDVGTDGIVITGGTGAVIGSGTSLAQHVADSTHNGYLSSTDWSTFNAKQAALAFGNLTDAGTDGIVVTGGSGAVIGSGVSLAQHVADSTHNGYLSSTDWSTFNGKQASGNYITALTGGVTASGPGSATATVVTNANLTGVVTSVGNATAIANGAIALAKLATTTAGFIPVGAITTGIPTYVAMSGDITIDSTGVTAIGTGVIINTDFASGSLATASVRGTVDPYSTNGVVYSGTYTPTLSNLINCSSTTVRQHTFSRSGSIVTVAGRVTATITLLAATQTGFDFTLPVATTNFADGFQGDGTVMLLRGASSANNPGVVITVSGAQTAQVYVNNSTVPAGLTGDFFYTFQYKIQ